MNFAESPSRIIYDYLMVSQTYTNSTFQALFLTRMRLRNHGETSVAQTDPCRMRNISKFLTAKSPW
jgi:hypothetical protein